MEVEKNPDPLLTQVTMELPEITDPTFLDEMTAMVVVLGESLLTPSLQTSITVHNNQHHLPIKQLDKFKDKIIRIKMKRPILTEYGYQDNMTVEQVIFRLDSRSLIHNRSEQFTLRACDQTLLNDAENLVSHDYGCSFPSDVTSDVLQRCAGARRVDIEKAGPKREYRAENIHPFQVVAQQAQAALANGNDPSFVHYMTYEPTQEGNMDRGTHHFKSLFNLTKQSPIINLKYSETYAQQGYRDPNMIATHSFPCDFDLLSDLLNGIDSKGRNISTGLTFNPLMKQFSMFNGTIGKCNGIGKGIPNITMTNENSAENQRSCPDFSKTYAQLRQARMSLLEQDKIALRVTVPWNPIYHAGKVIRVNIQNNRDKNTVNYGSGDYLIVSMVHNILNGGYSTTTMDCVSNTVGEGIV